MGVHLPAYVPIRRSAPVRENSPIRRTHTPLIYPIGTPEILQPHLDRFAVLMNGNVVNVRHEYTPVGYLKSTDYINIDVMRPS